MKAIRYEKIASKGNKNDLSIKFLAPNAPLRLAQLMKRMGVRQSRRKER